MPESDVTKMKVADLKRELKLRGLSVTGNKTELQDRLQTALLDGELALDDSAITGDDLLDEDGVLTDEEDAKILVGDENDLLKSPINITPETVPDTEKTTTDDDLLSTPSTAAKKIILKRQTSATKNLSSSNTSKENTEPTPPKTLKMSERNPITIGEIKNDTTVSSETAGAANATKKVAQLTAQERLDLRAKKFGINKTIATVGQTPPTPTKNESVPIIAEKVIPDEKQIEILKKRAERFGCVVSSKMAKLDAEERLEKRKQRFGGETVGSNSSNSAAADSWSEKARKRLERFGDTGTTPTVKTTTIASSGIISTGNE